MEPPPFGDGNSPTPPESERRERRFNGATAFRRWKLEQGGPAGELVDLASMEPPPFGDGNPGLRLHQQHEPDASMEPPPFGDGNHHCRQAQRSSPNCFNGATAFRRWKPPEGRASPAPCSWLQWSHRLSAMETPRGEGKPGPLQLASMEPPPFGDGNPQRGGQARPPAAGFNGATAFRRWKPPEGRASPAPCSWLQWSHRLSAMETPRGEGKPGPLQLASMEPPPFGDGNG